MLSRWITVIDQILTNQLENQTKMSSFQPITLQPLNLPPSPPDHPTSL